MPEASSAAPAQKTFTAAPWISLKTYMPKSPPKKSAHCKIGYAMPYGSEYGGLWATMEHTLPAFQIAPPSSPAPAPSAGTTGHSGSPLTPFQYAAVTSAPATRAPRPKDGAQSRPAASGGTNFSGTRTDPPNRPTASA